MLDAFNAFFWVAGNVLVAYIGLALVVFAILYQVWFDPRATTGGKLIFRFVLSLVGVVGLVFVGLFVDPSSGREWFNYPGDVAFWRPAVRFVIWAYVAYTITSLAFLLWVRKFRPHKVKIAPDPHLVKVRHETSEIPIIESHLEEDVQQ